jgi:hypothetical protein
MSLYGLLGVQFFGELRNHCILKGTNMRYAMGTRKIKKYTFNVKVLQSKLHDFQQAHNQQSRNTRHVL